MLIRVKSFLNSGVTLFLLSHLRVYVRARALTGRFSLGRLESHNLFRDVGGGVGAHVWSQSHLSPFSGTAVPGESPLNSPG